MILNPEELHLIIRRLKKVVKPGIDKLRNKYLQQLVGYRNELDADEQQFLDYLAEVINLIFHVEEPTSVANYLSSNASFEGKSGCSSVRLEFLRQ